MAIAREWDGAGYDRVSTQMEVMGREVLDRLPLRGDETVLDSGCGSGRVTAALIERLPRGRVIGVDGSESMIAAARRRLGPAIDLRVADLVGLDLGERVDAVLSTATFHWIGDHDALFASLRANLRGGGRLVAQCGGIGNVRNIHAAAREAAAEAPFDQHLAGWRGPWNFATPQVTEARLRAAGFAEARCRLEPRPVTPEAPAAYLTTIVLGAHLERLPTELHERFVAATQARLPVPLTIDYVRLNIDARA
ncbi:MAG: Methyltransferase type 11 [Solirubrobacterales bacterium]|nr:Methyltransferase type 11 [Solirubrobacterales bacterium]